MMYGAGRVHEPRSLGRRMGDSVIAAVCTGLMAVLWASSIPFLLLGPWGLS